MSLDTSPPPFRIFNAKVSMFAQISAYDRYKKRFDELGVGSDSFKALLEKCRPIVSGLYVVNQSDSGSENLRNSSCSDEKQQQKSPQFPAEK